MIREESGEVQVPIFAKDALAQGKPLEGSRLRASVHDVAEDPLASPDKPRREGQGEGGLPGAKECATG
jgi:hypothetical protein